MSQTLETSRTVMRPFRLSDAEAAHAWFSDPEVMRYIPSGPDATVEVSRARITRYMDHEAQHGFSKWIILDKASGTPIGDSGFYTLPGEGDRPELGYRFARDYWGRGLAAEVATRWLQVAAPWYHFTRVYAFAHPDHAASHHVLKKIGFTSTHREVVYGMDAPLYEMELPASGSNQ